ncbi:MAG: ester cyclase [Saprospiraceae bacterium]|nr:ester cyclase [Saprospiraceae bacterium]MCF8250996.1 ester cyclase [Saprospiraceae bacterium]MCF8280325.1 ester cyclase [Bacteroidales bacterium]MCF8312852.1 ester cyclase [Saprospiraceae bacterium]MCF8441299.1 ester cyclase [Saprospiraceae bacterium]
MTIFRTTLLLGLAVMLSQTTFSQKLTKTSNNMDKISAKEMVRFLYDSILNTKQFDKLTKVISPEYTNELGGKGVEGFQKSIHSLVLAFPDAHWEIEDMVSESNKVVVKQKFTGTQTSHFQNIQPTNKPVSVEGIATYQLQDGKIINSQIQTDRLSFLQQLEIIPQNLTPSNENTVYFVDKFFVPKASIDEFTKQVRYNRAFIANLSGYIRGEAFEKPDQEGNLTIMTIAVWENQDKLNEAKQIVQAEFKRIGFNPNEFYQRLNIKMEREQYSTFKEK